MIGRDVDVYHLEKRKEIVPHEVSFQILERGPLRCAIQVEFQIGAKSHLKQIIRLSTESQQLDFEVDVDWHESHQFLKVEFPVNVRSMEATYEMQFGHYKRPTHWNTSWEVAKFEVRKRVFRSFPGLRSQMGGPE